MRLRRLTAVFWGSCIVVCLFILYVMTDLALKLPNTKPAIQDLDSSKWSSFESKLRHIEDELSQHHAVVGEIKSVVQQFVDKTDSQYHPPQKRAPKLPIDREMKVVGDEPPRMKAIPILNNSQCAMDKRSIPKTDIQMLSMYERISFEDVDGGEWKQGWKIQYSDSQWSKKNKLKVFIVPHSHNDCGWIKTFENYYTSLTRTIFSNIIEKLAIYKDMKFIWAEVSFLTLWWERDATAEDKARFQKYVHSGQLEIVTGGWVMNDEASSHWLSIIQQLTVGHQWLLHNIDVIPNNSWQIDPFGYSSAQPYILKLAGLQSSVIQRVHYIVKKELATNKQLEFYWRQLWDSAGTTDLLTHMMPFYSYDIPHSCGPDPKVCCQFDFQRLPGNGVSCPWNEPPKKITKRNLEERAFTILDQWRKKAQLYRSNVLLYPLGDDFRYAQATEWDNQYKNYEMLIAYINEKDNWNAEVQFGTLEDYFKELHKELKSSNLPVLTGDFFTYADRGKHYWSGYFTSRPFYKNMDRVLLAYVRAAEFITAQVLASDSKDKDLLKVQLHDLVEPARQALSLFQHHDAITGTSRDNVRADYAKKLHTAIKDTQTVIQMAAYYLLRQPKIKEQTQPDVFFDIDDIWQAHDEIPTRITIVLDTVSPSRKIVLYNALTFERYEIITIITSTPFVEVENSEGKVILCQVSPVVTGDKHMGIATNKFQVSFLANVKPLALSTYSVSEVGALQNSPYRVYSKIHIYNADYWNVELPQVFEVDQPSSRHNGDLSLKADASTRVVANLDGMLKAIVARDGTITPVHMDFVQYGTLKANDNNSGAYLFIPDGPSKAMKNDPYPEMVLIEGPVKTTLYSSLNFGTNTEMLISVSVNNNPTLPQSEVEVSNTLLVQGDDTEVAMRLSTGIRNLDTFYTDLNGMQMIKRKTFEKLPLQANYYPLPAATYIEDDVTRLTVLTSTPLGMAALQPGQIEIMQDRRLSSDDNRGLNQGVRDNVRTHHIFKIILEKAKMDCQRVPSSHPSGQLSVGAHVSQQLLLQPLNIMHYTAEEDSDNQRDYNAVRTPVGVDVYVASYRTNLSGKTKEGKLLRGSGLNLHRVHLDHCYDEKETSKWYPVGNGLVKLSHLVHLKPGDKVFNSTLTFVHIGEPINDDIAICPMEVQSVFINHQSKQ